MSCLSWNCRGLGNPQTEAKLADLVGKKDPKVVFLIETKVDKEIIERISCKMQYKFFVVVPRHNRGGGLALLWKEDFAMKVLTSSDNHIDGVVDQQMDDAWRFMGFYGEPEIASRENSWNLLRDLSHRHNFPWICLGDFNEILRLKKK
ncbi:hypothetical protein SO802_010939 [Lithocarpus litseifolius]|uniref:Endonuclease/exonuclease/phosphatase domain-containing protein n=1 Tax=Lithocarpus litseifolius TaxID=425828 RepID=A0AAW2DHV4_9ROSI